VGHPSFTPHYNLPQYRLSATWTAFCQIWIFFCSVFISGWSCLCDFMCTCWFYVFLSYRVRFQISALNTIVLHWSAVRQLCHLNLLLLLFHCQLILQSLDVVLHRLCRSSATCFFLFVEFLLHRRELIAQISNLIHQLGLLVFDSVNLLGTILLAADITQTKSRTLHITPGNTGRNWCFRYNIYVSYSQLFPVLV